MKILQKILVLALLMFSVWGCQIDDNAPIPIPPTTDFRTPYCGNFAFMSYAWDFSMGHTNYNDTVNFVGNISIWESTERSLIIEYRNGAFITPELMPGGILQDTNYIANNTHSSFDGAFNRKDTLDVKFGMGGLGSQGGRVIHGVRIQ